jgi:hypothetical protein
VGHCRSFLRWRDPDSNRGHHDFQGSPEGRSVYERPANQKVPSARLVGDAVGFA